MKFNFKKISAIAASALMVGMTMGVAAATNFPSPYSASTSSGVAIVSGTGAGVDDLTAVGDINTYLKTVVTASGGTVTGGDSYQFEKTSTKFNLGDNYTTIKSSLDYDELPSLLAEGTYEDSSFDEFDYSQTINMAEGILSMFEDNEYIEDQPTIGFKIASGSGVLNYTLDFSEEPLIRKLVSTTLPMMGKEYYVLTNDTTGTHLRLTLLDAAETVTLAEEASVVVVGKTVSIVSISETEVKLDIDGVSTGSLEETETQRIAGDNYIGIKDIMYNAKTGTLSSVEFSIGSGKLKLTDAGSVQINDNTVSGLTAWITNSTAAVDAATVTLDKIIIQWEADDDLFITETTEALMPGFEIVKLSFGGLNYPVEETIEIQQGGDTYAKLNNFPLKDGPIDIDLIYGADASGLFTGLGKDSTNSLLTSTGGSVTFTKNTNEEFVISSLSGTKTAESCVAYASDFNQVSTVNWTTLYFQTGGDTVTSRDVKEGDTFERCGADLTIGAISQSAKTVVVGATSNTFDRIYTKEGMIVYLPWTNNTVHDLTENGGVFTTAALACANRTGTVGSPLGEMYNGILTYNNSATGNTTTTGCPTFVLRFDEEDKDDTITGGDYIDVTLGWTATSPEVEVSSYATENADVTYEEIGDTDVFRDFCYSELATEILNDKPSGSPNSVKLIYHGGEVTADVYIMAPETIMGEVGNMVFTDAEKTSWQSRDVILVGGSCINEATADALGLTYPTCETAWQTATGVGDGQYLIKSIGDAFTTGKIALVVAGYTKADTAAAAQRLANKPETIDTTAGNEYLGVVTTLGESTITGPL